MTKLCFRLSALSAAIGFGIFGLVSTYFGSTDVALYNFAGMIIFIVIGRIVEMAER